MLMMDIPDVWKFQHFTWLQYGVNLFARWHQRLWFKRWRVWLDRIGI